MLLVKSIFNLRVLAPPLAIAADIMKHSHGWRETDGAYASN